MVILAFAFAHEMKMLRVRAALLKESQAAEEAAKQRIKEKDTILREIHHRMKNNMTVMSSLLNLQAEQTQDKAHKALLRESQNRIAAMSLVHEHLYASKDVTAVDFSNYIQSLLNILVQSHRPANTDIQVKIDAPRVRLAMSQANPCGLILTELITNSLKHGFKGRTSGNIFVSFSSIEDHFVLQVKDDGVGLPPAFDIRQVKSLGLQLVESLVGQLEGVLAISSQGGTEMKVTFPYIQ